MNKKNIEFALTSWKVERTKCFQLVQQQLSAGSIICGYECFTLKGMERERERERERDIERESEREREKEREKRKRGKRKREKEKERV